MMRYQTPRRRAAFTLIELLLVVTIIIVVVGLSVGTFFRVRKSQVEGASGLIVNKLSSQLNQQWLIVLDNAKTEVGRSDFSTFNNSAFTWSDGDPRRMRVIHTKMKLRLEFPQTFWEAVRWPSTVGLGGLIKSSYSRQLLTPTGPIPLAQITGTGLTDDQIHQESAVLLYLALTQARGGIGGGFNPIDHLGPHAVGEITLSHYASQPTFKVFVDAWKQPIAFVRWPVGSDDTYDINQPPYATYSTIAGVNSRIDPQDPEQTLHRGFTISRAQFISNVHSLGNAPLNLSPIIISAGPDKEFGIQATFARIDAREDDNIYSHRIRGVGRK